MINLNNLIIRDEEEDEVVSLAPTSPVSSGSSSTDTESLMDLFWPLTTFNTTIDRHKQYMKAFKDLSENYYFCRLSLPEDKKISTEKNKLWGLLKQAQQYKYFRSVLLRHQSTTCIQYCFCYFEQFKSGNLHIHLILNIGDNHIINLKSEFAELFGIKKKGEMKAFFHHRKGDDIQETHDYLFNKKEHEYENIDQEKFKPIILINKENYKTNDLKVRIDNINKVI